MPAIYEHSHIVREAEIDVLGHANNLAYLAWMQAAALAHSAAQGWPTERYQELGAGWVVRSHQVEYLRPAYAGDALVVHTWVATFRKITSLRRYKIVRQSDQRVLCTGATDWAFIDYKTGRPTRLPPGLTEAFELVDAE